MRIKGLLYGIILSISYGPILQAQVEQPQRVEYSMEDSEEFKVSSANDKGVFLFREAPPSNRPTQAEWEVHLLDTTLHTVWKMDYEIETGSRYISHHYNDNHLHILFTNDNTRDHHFTLWSVDVYTGALTKANITNFIPFAFYDFKVMGRIVLLGGYFNYRPLVVLYNLEEHIPRILPGLFNDKATLIEIKLNGNNTFDVLLKALNFEKNNTLVIYTFDKGANLVKKINLDTERSKGLLFGRSEALEGDAQLVAGVYGRRRSDYSRGIFIANINAYGEQRINFYNYSELKNFFKYMKARREKRVLKRIERRKIKNKKIRFNYRLLVHDLMYRDGQYILLGEAFYPKYKTLPGHPGLFTPGWAYNRGVYESSVVFDGYRYTHAVILGFDETGNLLWDNSFEINDVISFELEQFVHVNPTSEKIMLMYVYDDAIRTKIISGNKVLEGKEEYKIGLIHEHDEVSDTDTEISGLEKWYGNTFFTYGVQTIKNNQAKGVPLSREVFFVNKVVFQ